MAAPNNVGSARDNARSQSSQDESASSIFSQKQSFTDDEKKTSQEPTTGSKETSEQASDALGKQASFFETFASAEDLARFQTIRVKSFLAVVRSEFQLARKAVLVSFALFIVAGFLSFSVWGIINVSVFYAITIFGYSPIIALAALFILNALALSWVVRELRAASKHVNLQKTFSLATANKEKS